MYFHATRSLFRGIMLFFLRNPSFHQLLTLVRHLGYSWSPGRTLKEIGTLSARRLAQKASQMARCTALNTTSSPVNATKAMGRQHSSGGSSHWEPAILIVQLWIHLKKTNQHHSTSQQKQLVKKTKKLNATL